MKANPPFLKWIFFLSFFLIFSFHLKAQTDENGWQWQYPKPQGNTIHDIFMFSKDTLCAVGDLGTFMKTTDGGKSWDVKHHIGNTSYNLESVHFVDRNNGWAAGGIWFTEKNVLLKTTDAGDSWTEVSVNTKLPLLSVYFVDSDTGIVVGEDGIVLRTTDGGKNWDTKKMDVYISQDRGRDLFLDIFRLYRVTFTDKNNGWVIGAGYYGDQIYRTTDCGKSWKWTDSIAEKRIWSSLYDVSFVGKKNVFMVGDQGVFIKSSDGGLSWKYQNLSEKYKNEKYQYFYSLSFKDSLTGWIVGGNGTINDSWGGHILKTTDGGENWTEINPDTSYGQLLRVRFFDKNNGFIMGQSGLLFKTTDAGQSWNPLRKEAITIRSVSFADENIGWAVGDSGLIMNTTDGGSTWVKQYYDRDRRFYSVHAIDKNNAWVAGGMLYRAGEPDPAPKPPVLYTTDGGQHWLSKEGDFLSGAFFYVTFQNDSLGWLSGKVLLKTTDKGQTWKKIPFDFKSVLNKVQFINDSTGWLSYSTGNTLLKTRDKGVTWKEQVVDSNFTVRSFFFVNEEVGYSVGQLNWKEAIIKTTDGGKSWFPTNKPLIGGYSTIYFLNEKTGWLGGFDIPDQKSVIIKTTDGGNTWFDQNCPLNDEVINFCFLNGSTAWALGNGIVKTTNGGGVVSVEEPNVRNNKVIPSHMDLMQNYPNPFNPATTIRYSVTNKSHVKLMVYDMLGREIITLVNKEQNAGEYNVRFDASSLPSGMYIYSMQAGEFRASKKLLLIK
ncbi:MAG TPA: YCF48-related protein [Ignavibacteriales bacterium]|nr:YCF48-related protein [Ignavibacteriales bacterium]